MPDSAMRGNVIEARGLLKVYGSTRAVDAIDLDIQRGEIFGLLGPNGAGKTTAILMMLGLTEVSGGTVEVLGFNPVREPLEVKRRVGYLPDAVGFYDHLTARENLLYTARLLGIPRSQTGGASWRRWKASSWPMSSTSGSPPIRVACASGWASPRLS
jgi:ABC-2 type transport system ATP-binding protein